MQNLLLALGGLLLAGAALVFAAVTYERLGASGRAAVLATLTLVAAVAAPRLRRRGLTSTAETVGAVVLALAALDAYGLRTLGLAADSGAAAYAAGSAAVLAAAGGVYGRLTGLRAVQVLAVLAAQLPVPLLLVHTEASDRRCGPGPRSARGRRRRRAGAARPPRPRRPARPAHQRRGRHRRSGRPGARRERRP